MESLETCVCCWETRKETGQGQWRRDGLFYLCLSLEWCVEEDVRCLRVVRWCVKGAQWRGLKSILLARSRPKTQGLLKNPVPFFLSPMLTTTPTPPTHHSPVLPHAQRRHGRTAGPWVAAVGREEECSCMPKPTPPPLLFNTHIHAPTTHHTHTINTAAAAPSASTSKRMANEAGACQTRNVNDYEDEEENEKESAPLDEGVSKPSTHPPTPPHLHPHPHSLELKTQDIALLKTYGLGPYTTSIKKVEEDIKNLQVRTSTHPPTPNPTHIPTHPPNNRRKSKS